VFPADDKTEDFAESVPKGAAFDVVAKVEIGRNLMQFADADLLYVTVGNLSKSSILATEKLPRTIKPEDRKRNDTLRVDIKPGWVADVGDVLQVTASYRAEAGIHTDFSSAQSGLFVVVDA
jgi:hypothetical protein